MLYNFEFKQERFGLSALTRKNMLKIKFFWWKNKFNFLNLVGWFVDLLGFMAYQPLYVI